MNAMHVPVFVKNSDRTHSGGDADIQEHYPIARELRFRARDKHGEITGSGETVNIGSKRLEFRTDKELRPGKRIEVAISWPARLDNRCALKLLARGRILNVAAGIIAVSIEQHEFRTVGAHGLTM